MIGSTIAEMIVISVRASTAAKIDVIELNQASEIFLKSCIVVFSLPRLSDPSEHELPVEIDRRQNAGNHRNHQPHFSRYSGNQTDECPNRLPNRAENRGPERLAGIRTRCNGADDLVDMVISRRGLIHGVLDHIQRTFIRRSAVRWSALFGGNIEGFVS